MNTMKSFLLSLLLLLSSSVMAETYTRNLITAKEQLSSNASDRDEGKDLGALIDNDVWTFWHSDWHGQVKDQYHYVQVKLNASVQGKVSLSMTRRMTGDDHPTLVGISSSSDGKNWEELTDLELPYNGQGTTEVSSPWTVPAGCQYLRITAKDCTGSSNFGFRTFWHAAEIQLIETIDTSEPDVEVKDLITRSSQISSNASDMQEGQNLGALIDRNSDTFWHSDWHDQVQDTHYLQFALDEPITGDLVIYVQRRMIDTDHVTKLGLHGSNDKTNWTPIRDVELGNAEYGAEYTTAPISMNGKSYKYLRFYLLESNRGNIFGHFAEFHLGEIKAKEPTPDEPPTEQDSLVQAFRDLLVQAEEAYTNAKGYSERELTTSISVLSSNASDRDEGKDLGALIDNDVYTFWHSDWRGQVHDTHYLQLNLEQAAQGDIIVYVQRRLTENDHVTRMSLQGSNDGNNWTYINDVKLENASAGAEYTTKPISLNGGQYKMLRFNIDGTTTGRIFGHFAEFHVSEVNVFGDNLLLDLVGIADNFYALIQQDKEILPSRVTQGLYDELEQQLNGFLQACQELRDDTGGVLQSVDKIRQSVTYSIRGLEDRGYLVYNPEVTDKWVSLLGCTKADETLGNEAYTQQPDLGRAKNVWQFVSYEGEWYLYNPEARRFLYSDGTTAYQLSSQPAPIHIVALGDGTFALNGVEDDKQSTLFARIDPSKEVKPLQRGTLEDAATHFIIEKANVRVGEVNVEQRLREMRLPVDLSQLTNLPTVYINTFDEQGIYSKDTYKYANLWRVNGDVVDRYDSLEIRGRGNSTWGLAKKPYRIKFNDKEKFLGSDRANAKSWTLMANHTDKTLIRNAVASYIGTQFGQSFTPAASYVDLYLNDQYLGNYQISDQIQIKKKRINIVEQEEPATAESDITGGYLLEIDGTAYSDPVMFSSNGGTPVSIKSPDEEVINWDQREYIQNFYNDFEQRALGSDFADPEKGYRAVVDSTSLASWFLTVEYTANVDGFYSIYLYKDRGDDHLYFGPIWDYDIAFNNCSRLGEMTDKMMTFDGYRTGAAYTWLPNMWSDPWFRNLTGRLWHKSVREGLVDKTLNFIDSMAVVVDESQQKNFEIWPIDQRVYDEVTLWSTYQEGVDYLKKFVVEHAQFLSSVMPDPQEGVDPDPQPEEPDTIIPGPDPKPEPIEILDSHYYTIYNVGNQHPTDVNDDLSICTWAMDDSRRESQQWYLQKVGDEAIADGDKRTYYRIISRGSKLAITDMAEQSGDATFNPGSNLMLQEINPSDPRQLWCFVPCAGNWVIENRMSYLAWNNSNGSSENGNPVISWKNDADNEQKPTRQWRIEMADERVADGIAATQQDKEYRLVYSPESQKISVRVAYGDEAPEGTMTLYTIGGQQLASSSLAQPMDVRGVARGIYVLRWTTGGKERAVKVQIR